MNGALCAQRDRVEAAKIPCSGTNIVRSAVKLCAANARITIFSVINGLTCQFREKNFQKVVTQLLALHHKLV